MKRRKFNSYVFFQNNLKIISKKYKKNDISLENLTIKKSKKSKKDK